MPTVETVSGVVEGARANSVHALVNAVESTLGNL